MNILNRLLINLAYAAFLFTALASIHPSPGIAKNESRTPAVLPETDQDLTIKYYNRELTPDGVLRESSYDEKMLRRNGHVWSYRVLAPATTMNDEKIASHEHKDFNYIVLPRHVSFDGNRANVAFINAHERQVINIAPTEYENVNFDGSWRNTYYLIDPQVIAAMPISTRNSAVSNAHWHEQQKNGLFQRVLWDDKRAIPLIIETGNQRGTFFQRISVASNARLKTDLPWNHQQGYAHKEYSDFLD